MKQTATYICLMICAALNINVTQAAIIEGTFQGVLDSGSETAQGGLFGLGAGAPTAGRQFTGTFTYDTSQLGGASPVAPGENLFGGSGPLPSSISTTLNGQTITIDGDASTRVDLANGYSGNQGGFTLESQTNPGSNAGISFWTTRFQPITDITNPGGVSFSAVPIGTESLFTFSYYYNYDAATNAYLSLQTLHGALTSISVAPVPLPASAWLLFSGLGALGAAALKRRAVN